MQKKRFIKTREWIILFKREWIILFKGEYFVNTAIQTMIDYQQFTCFDIYIFYTSNSNNKNYS